ncbi:FMN-binding protein [Liberiplasma polymorphum]|uniref:FMN-binding protein n=1 Tax=Liberiplasma polymorphum TaxID=3374570 RepID=UPI0037730DCF
MKRFVIIIGVIAIVFCVIFGILTWMTKGLEQGENQVVESVNISELNDGVYEVDYDYGRWQTSVLVTIQNGVIISIEVVKTVTFEREDITSSIIDEVIINQSLEVDVVAGATVTSLAYLKAIEDALLKAK